MGRLADRRLPRRLVRRSAYLVLVLLELSVLWVWLHAWAPVPGTPLQLLRRAQGQAPQPTPGDGRWVPLEAVVQNFGRAVVVSEDQRFCQHTGFDVQAIRQAVQDKLQGKRLRGASTISQQTAKNVFLWPGRSWLRKGLEVWFTFWVEALWGKARILEVYLNIIETGPGLYGVDAWSWRYLNKPPAKASLYEAALLAVCLPNPRRYTPHTAGPYLLQRRQWVVRQAGNQAPCQLGAYILFP